MPTHNNNNSIGTHSLTQILHSDKLVEAQYRPSLPRTLLLNGCKNRASFDITMMKFTNVFKRVIQYINIADCDSQENGEKGKGTDTETYTYKKLILQLSVPDLTLQNVLCSGDQLFIDLRLK